MKSGHRSHGNFQVSLVKNPLERYGLDGRTLQKFLLSFILQVSLLVDTWRVVWNIVESSMLCVWVLHALERCWHFPGHPGTSFQLKSNVLLFCEFSHLKSLNICSYHTLCLCLNHYLPSLFVRSAMRRLRPSNFSAGRITCSWQTSNC